MCVSQAKYSHLISVILELRVFKQSEVVETGRSLRSWSWPDSAKLMIKREGSWQEGSVRGKNNVCVCVWGGVY